MLHDAFDGSVAAVEMSKFVFLALFSGCMCRFSYLKWEIGKFFSEILMSIDNLFPVPVNLRIDCIMMFPVAQ